MRSVKEALAMFGGQPKENKGMGAVTFMVRASRNRTVCSLKLGQVLKSGWSSWHTSSDPRDSCPTP